MRVAWDKAGERRYETGVDRGVVYLPDGTVVPWNGLTSIEEDTSGVDVEEFYFSGIKYLEVRSPGDFSGSIKAYTYPKELDAFEGRVDVGNGMILTDQPVDETFSLCYRTKIGNDLEGIDYGYKIHVVYNLTASPDSISMSTITENPEASDFGWSISAVPEYAPGYRPTAHAIFDTTAMDPNLIDELEKILYGTDAILTPPPPDAEVWDGGSPSFSTSDIVDGGTPTSTADGVVVDPGTNPGLPALSELMSFVSEWVLIDVTDNGDGTWTATGPDPFVRLLDSTTFQIETPQAVYLDANTYQIPTTDDS